MEYFQKSRGKYPLRQNQAHYSSPVNQLIRTARGPKTSHSFSRTWRDFRESTRVQWHKDSSLENRLWWAPRTSGHEWAPLLQVPIWLASCRRPTRWLTGLKPSDPRLTQKRLLGLPASLRAAAYPRHFPAEARLLPAGHQGLHTSPSEICTSIPWMLCKCRSVESEPGGQPGQHFQQAPWGLGASETPDSHVDFKSSCGECFSFLHLKHSFITSLLRVEKFQEPSAKPWRWQNEGFQGSWAASGWGTRGLVTWTPPAGGSSCQLWMSFSLCTKCFL